jgi:hypothetical protein
MVMEPDPTTFAPTEPPPAVTEAVPWTLNVDRLYLLGKIGLGLGFLGSIAFLVHLVETGDVTVIKGIIMAPVAGASVLVMPVLGWQLLTAPSSFYRSAEGRVLLDAIGTQSVPFARFALGVALVAGCGLFGTIAFIILTAR